MASDLTGIEVADIVLNYINNMSLDSTDFVETILGSHRTLQQSTMNLFMETIRAWSKVLSDRYDLRNEATILTCKEIVSKIERAEFRLPFI